MLTTLLPEATDTIFVHFRHPETDEPIFSQEAEGVPPEREPVGVTLYSPGTRQYKGIEAGIQTANLRRGKKLTGEALQAAALDQLAGVVKSFHGLPLDPSQAREFFDDPRYFAYRDQAQRALDDAGNAYRKPATR